MLTRVLTILTGRYDVLGNFDPASSGKIPAQPEDLFARTKFDFERRIGTAKEEELRLNCRINVDAKRHEKALEKECLALRLQLADKEAELRLLRERPRTSLT